VVKRATLERMVRFGECSVDVDTRTVECDGRRQHLEPQAFDLLAYLLAHRSRVIPKAELLDEVWGDQFVSESALTTRIKEIRRALGDDGTRQAIVKNFRGHGYRFVADVVESSGPSRAAGASATSLVGRDADLDAIARLLRTSQLVTLVGPGGVGKTTLARELSEALGGAFPGGVRLVRLAPISESASIVHVLGRDTRVGDVGADERALVEAIASLDALLVLDNCEHLIAEASRLVGRILACGGPVRILATSRERLGISGEHVWPLAPLDDGAARDLLLARARLAQPGYSWGAEEEADVTRLVQTIDRLPLAIEMAAARLPTIGVAELADVVARRLDLLRSPDRASEERHRTIEELVGWSESLLSSSERELLATMSVFAGPVPVGDIAAVVGAEAAEIAIGPLAGLVDKSLAVADVRASPSTYRLLETVRAVASQRRSPDAAARHARHVVDAVVACDRLVRGPDEAVAAARLDQLTIEIRVAHAWARHHDVELAGELTAALLRVSIERSWAEPALWAGELGDRAELPAWVRSAVAAACAADAANRGDLSNAAELAAQAARSDDDRILGSALDTLANVAIYTGDVESACRHGIALHELGERSGDATHRTLGAISQALAAAYDGDVAAGRACFDRLVDPSGLGPTSEAWLAYAAGELQAAAGRFTDAGASFERAIELGESVGSSFVVSVSRVSSLAAATRRRDASVDDYLPLLEQYRRLRNLTHAVTMLRNLVGAMVDVGMAEPAMTIVGALSHPAAKSTYGSESDWIDAARAAASERSGKETVDGWIRSGARHDSAWALDRAIDVLTDRRRLGRGGQP